MSSEVTLRLKLEPKRGVVLSFSVTKNVTYNAVSVDAVFLVGQ
jgi:hypothetical protein